MCGQSTECAAETATNTSDAQHQHSKARAIPGANGGMTSPFSAWAGGSDGESQVNQARMKALGRRRKSHKKIALEVVKEADKEGEEGACMHIWHVMLDGLETDTPADGTCSRLVTLQSSGCYH